MRRGEITKPLVTVIVMTKRQGHKRGRTVKRKKTVSRVIKRSQSSQKNLTKKKKRKRRGPKRSASELRTPRKRKKRKKREMTERTLPRTAGSLHRELKRALTRVTAMSLGEVVTAAPPELGHELSTHKIQDLGEKMRTREDSLSVLSFVLTAVLSPGALLFDEARLLHAVAQRECVGSAHHFDLHLLAVSSVLVWTLRNAEDLPHAAVNGDGTPGVTTAEREEDLDHGNLVIGIDHPRNQLREELLHLLQRQMAKKVQRHTSHHDALHIHALARDPLPVAPHHENVLLAMMRSLRKSLKLLRRWPKHEPRVKKTHLLAHDMRKWMQRKASFPHLKHLSPS